MWRHRHANDSFWYVVEKDFCLHVGAVVGWYFLFKHRLSPTNQHKRMVLRILLRMMWTLRLLHSCKRCKYTTAFLFKTVNVLPLFSVVLQQESPNQSAFIQIYRKCADVVQRKSWLMFALSWCGDLLSQRVKCFSETFCANCFKSLNCWFGFLFKFQEGEYFAHSALSQMKPGPAHRQCWSTRPDQLVNLCMCCTCVNYIRLFVKPHF